MITQFFDPESGSAAIPGSIARALCDEGLDLEVITGFPNYPSGRIYDGYRQSLHQKEVIRGLPVRRIPIFPNHGDSALGRIANFVSFMLSASTLGAWLARRSHVALIYSTSTTVGVAGLVLRHFFRRKYVLFIQDLWPDTIIATGMLPKRIEPLAAAVINRLSGRIYRSAARIAVISPGLKQVLIERGIAADKIDVVYNWVDETVFGPTNDSEIPDRDHLEVMYAGNLGEVQGLDTAIRAIALASNPVRLRMVGSGVAESSLKMLASTLGVEDRVTFEGVQPVERMSTLMAEADAQLVCLRDDPLFHITLPSKIQAILASGRAIITCAPGDAATVTRASGAGWCVPPASAGALAALFDELAVLPREEFVARGRRAREYYEAELAAAVGAQRLHVALQRAAAHSSEQRPGEF